MPTFSFRWRHNFLANFATAWATATHIELLRAQDGTRQGPVLDIPDTRTLELSRDGSLLAVSSAKNPFLVVVDVATKKEILRSELESAVVKAGFSSDGKYLATSSENGDLKLLNVQTRNLTDVLKGVNAQLLLFSNDGSFLIAGGGRDASRVRADAPEGEFPLAIHLIETTTGKVRSVIQIAREAVAAAFSMTSGLMIGRPVFGSIPFAQVTLEKGCAEMNSPVMRSNT